MARLELLRTAPLPIHKVIINAILQDQDGMNGIYLYFVNKHCPRWPLLGLIFPSRTLERDLEHAEEQAKRYDKLIQELRNFGEVLECEGNLEESVLEKAVR